MNVPVKVLLCAVLLVGVFVVFSCNKNTYYNNGPSNPGNSATALWPLKAGNAWIYQDSVFNPDSSLMSEYPDTIRIGTQTNSDPGAGLLFYGLTDPNPNGWFSTGSYIAVDPYNTTIYELDSLSYSPYLFFQTAQQDGVLLGTGSDFTNPTCVKQASQYGFATESVVNKHTCLKNIQYTVDCNKVTTEVVVTYVSQGVGLVRIEDYLVDTARSNNLYLGYSQTLQSFTLAQ